MVKKQAQILKALRDYDELPAVTFMRKYKVETIREAEGFTKALKWVLR